MNKYWNKGPVQSDVYKAPTFEQAVVDRDWAAPCLNEPRTFTIKNIRDIFFTLLNQSQTQKRVCETEDNIRLLWGKCSQLNKRCEELDNKIDQTKDTLDDQHKKFHEEFEKSCEEIEQKFQNHLRKIMINREDIAKSQRAIMELQEQHLT